MRKLGIFILAFLIFASSLPAFGANIGPKGGGDTLPIADTTSVVEGSADATKEIRFEVDGLTTATTRILTALDRDVTLGLVGSGSTVPTSPITGELFLHTPTGRSFWLTYDGASWIPLISIGSATIYVDSTDGTDSIDKGGAVDSGAFKTIQYAVDSIPGLVGGSITINVNNESYAEAVIVRGKNFTGPYYIHIIGTMTNVLSEVTNADIFSENTIGKTGSGWTVNAYQKKIIRITSGTGVEQRGIIASNTSDTITIKAAWSSTNSEIINTTTNGVNPDSTSDFVVEDWGTDIDQSSGTNHCFTVTAGQQAVILQDMKLINASSRAGFRVENGAVGEAFACFGTGGRPFTSQAADLFYLRSCAATAGTATACVLIQDGTKFSIFGLYIYTAGAGITGVRIDNGSVGHLYGTKIDGMGSHGLNGQSSAQIIIGFTTGTACEFLNNGGWGVLAATGSLIQKASNAVNTYSGNTSGTYSPTTSIAGGTN